MLSAQPRLLTPGPLALAPEVKACMQTDLGSRDLVFRQVTRDIRRSIQELCGAGPDYSVVPVQGSGTFAIEAALTTFVKPGNKVLVCANGVYGDLAEKILRRHRLDHAVIRRPITEPVSVDAVAARLAADPAITHLYFVHCETTSGILNPLAELVALARSRGVTSMVDAMSALGAIEIDAAAVPFDILLSSGNKCIEAPPGIAFAVVRRALLTEAGTAVRTYTLDLFDQWSNFEATGEWRSTPPTHVAQALRAALDALCREGGPARRGARYTAVRDRLVAGLRPLGFAPIVPPQWQSPICVAFRADAVVPDADAFAAYYQHLRDAGLFIYAKFHSESRSFRVGCIGQIQPDWVDDLIAETGRFAGARRAMSRGAGGVRMPAAAEIAR